MTGIFPISTKHRLHVGSVLTICLSLAPLVSHAGAAEENGVVRQALDRMFRMDYPAAEEILLQGLPSSSPAQPYFAGTVCLNRFLDWGDTTALRRAEGYWEKISPRGDPSPTYKSADPTELRLYRGLAGFQQGYIASLRGQRLRPAALALAARQQLLPLNRPEARATLMLYDYYRRDLLGKLPFVSAPDFAVAEFRKAADASPLRDMLLSSLFWILIDRQQNEAALRIADSFLERYPENRTAHEMRGSALFHAGRWSEARLEYENLREEYSQLKKVMAKSPERLPLGYYRALGNLARTSAALDRHPEAENLWAEWNRASQTGVWFWLPSSLKEGLEDLKK